jgi:hypothetical protein
MKVIITDIQAHKVLSNGATVQSIAVAKKTGGDANVWGQSQADR